MINLLPPTSRRNLRAAHTNSLLARYNIGLLAALIFMVLAFGFTYFYLNISNGASEQAIQENTQREAAFAKTKQAASAFRSNLSTAKQILANQVNYSQLIINIAHALPSHVVLQSLSLDPSTFGKPTTITAYAKTTNDALRLKDTLTKHPELFQNVSLQSIATSGQATVPGYPVTVSLNLTIQPGAAS